MLPLLVDEGLPPQVAHALNLLGLEVYAIGDEGAPPEQSSDEANCAWCKQRGAVLVTNDRGRKNRIILKALASAGVHALFVHNDLRGAPPHHLVRALLSAEQAIDDLATRRKGLIHHRLGLRGRLEPR